jgi:ABC-type cobalamin transport system permease subunit
VNVTLQQGGLAPRSNRTQSDGVATFSSISGGNIQITIYLSGQTQPYVAEAVFVGSSTTIGVKLQKYVILAGFLVDTGTLTTVVLIAALLILVLLVEVYRRKRSKPQQKPELEPK